jgi:N-acetylglucosamine kinase-like BadF-type ATPase
MRYIVAYDGGGSKTHIMVLNLQGEILFDKVGEGSNHQSLGGEKFKQVIGGLFLDAKKFLIIENSDIELIYLGLSGADLESDFDKLNKACATIFKDVPFKVVNDAWIIMRSGLNKPYGAVAISGTGTNSAAINHQGERAILRSLGFTLGIYGGGLDIAREAMHYAFRADELTYKDTVLKDEVLKLFNVKSMDDIVDMFYPINNVDRIKFGELTKIVNDCAILGDEVSQDILTRVGKTLGYQTAGVIRQVGIEKEKVPVVVGGRVFSGKSSLLLDEFTISLNKICPQAYIVKPKYKPVIGAYLAALDELNIKQTEVHDKNLK